MYIQGHNHGHGHSGKNYVTYADPTCNMGNQGSWSDTGSAFCFNGPKTWANGWYSAYHLTVTPSSSNWDGTLVGINAVPANSVTSGQRVVIRITGSGETDLYMIFNHQTGALASIPQDGNEVVISSQASTLYDTSSWEAGLSNGQTYTKANWAGSPVDRVCMDVAICCAEAGVFCCWSIALCRRGVARDAY